jgi:SHS2 domain-containing protein
LEPGPVTWRQAIAGRYRSFSHTADLGLEIEADAPEELFATAGRALTEQMALPEPSAERLSERIVLEGDGWEDLFVHWLNTLLLRSEVGGAWWTDFAFERLSATRLAAVVSGPRRGPGHTLLREVKAVSYHDLELQLAPGRCRARVILDL